MYTSKIQLRVRYGETDRMGYAYYGAYAEYFEVARVEALRNLGMSYKELEDSGILLPVYEYSVKFLRPAYYDEVLTINTTIIRVPLVRLCFSFEVINEKDKLITMAEATLVFIDKQSGKPRRAPNELIKQLADYFP